MHAYLSEDEVLHCREFTELKLNMNVLHIGHSPILKDARFLNTQSHLLSLIITFHYLVLMTRDILMTQTQDLMLQKVTLSCTNIKS